MRLARCVVMLGGLSLLPGCASLLTEGTSTGAGIAGTGISTAVTRDATVAAGIGLGVAAVADAALQYGERRVHGAEQNAIAATAGPLDVGAVAPWSIVHDVPIEDDEHGEVTVSRSLGTGAFACKDIVFTVDTVAHKKPVRAFYTATVCREGTEWKWATAEPATERWGSLQ